MTINSSESAREPNELTMRLTHAMPALCAVSLASAIPTWLEWGAVKSVTGVIAAFAIVALITMVGLGGLFVLGVIAVKVTEVHLFYAVFDVAFVVLCYSEWRHHYLQPWCPRCQGWEEGGEPEVVPDPDPAESGTR